MAKTNAIDPSSPSGDSDRRQGDDAIRDQAKGVAETLEVDHYIGSDGGIGNGYNEDAAGEHAKVTLRATSKPSNVAAKGFIYTKDIGGGVIELFYEDAAGNEIPLSSAGKLGSAATDILANILAVSGTLGVTGVATLTATAVLSSGASCGSKVLSAVANPVAAQDASTKLFTNNPITLSAGNESEFELSIGAFQIKCGEVNRVGNVDHTITFTTEGLSAFDNNCFQIFLTLGDNVVTDSDPRAYTLTKTSFHLQHNIAGTPTIRWFAIGR